MFRWAIRCGGQGGGHLQLFGPLQFHPLFESYITAELWWFVVLVCCCLLSSVGQKPLNSNEWRTLWRKGRTTTTLIVTVSCGHFKKFIIRPTHDHLVFPVEESCTFGSHAVLDLAEVLHGKRQKDDLIVSRIIRYSFFFPSCTEAVISTCQQNVNTDLWKMNHAFVNLWRPGSEVAT